jgi:hypothetical protein
MSPREERVRNVLARTYGRGVNPLGEQYQKAQGSTRPLPPLTARVIHEMASGLLVSAAVAAVDPEDFEPVFRKITRGLFFKHFERHLGLDIPIAVRVLDEDHARRFSQVYAKELMSPRQWLGSEFASIRGTLVENPEDGVWLFLVFGAGMVGSFTGRCAAMHEVIPNASGIPIRN